MPADSAAFWYRQILVGANYNSSETYLTFGAVVTSRVWNVMNCIRNFVNTKWL